MRLGADPKLWCRLNSWRLDFGKRLIIYVLLCDDGRADKLIARRPEIKCRKEIAWCLWCLLRTEIGTIYAEPLKELQNAKRWRLPMFMRFSCMLLKT